MKLMKQSLKLAAVFLAFGLLAGCESGGGGSHVSGSMYYGVGYYDPWYYGGYYDNPDIIVIPPGNPSRPVHPEQPIARPPTPRPTPMPRRPTS